VNTPMNPIGEGIVKKAIKAPGGGAWVLRAEGGGGGSTERLKPSWFPT